MELYYWPEKDYWEQVHKVLNEINILFMCYHLFMLTDIVDLEVRQVHVGNSILIFIYVNVSVDILYFVVPMVLGWFKKCKYSYVKCIKKWRRGLGI